jgi:hypothetical protein
MAMSTISSIGLTFLSTILRRATRHTCFGQRLLHGFSRSLTNMSSREKGFDTAEERPA